MGIMMHLLCTKLTQNYSPQNSLSCMFPFRVESLPGISGGESGKGKVLPFGGVRALFLVIPSKASLGAAVKGFAERAEVDFKLMKWNNAFHGSDLIK